MILVIGLEAALKKMLLDRILIADPKFILKKDQAKGPG
jgi:hypothetical protein